MHFTVRNAFPCSADHLWELLATPAFERASDEEARVEKTLLERRPGENGLRHERIRFRFLDPLPKVASKVLGTTNLTYEQVQVVNDTAHTLDWEIIPPVAKDRFKSCGTFRISATPTGCERVVDGVMEVSVPLVGGKLEEAICGQVTQSYEKSAAFVLKKLRG